MEWTLKSCYYLQENSRIRFIMLVLKILKRFSWDVWLVLYNVCRDFFSRPDCSEKSVRDLYEIGLHIFPDKMDREYLNILRDLYKELMGTSVLSKTGQDAGRLYAHGLLNERLTCIVEPMREIANKYLCVERANLELTYFQESIARADIDSVPGGEFHIDDNKSNIKFFVYLSDVTAENGPFVVVPKTHRWSEFKRIFTAFDWAVTKRRDALYFNGDSSVLESNARYLVGGVGTYFIVDTTAWHRAEPVVEGSRRVFVASFNR